MNEDLLKQKAKEICQLLKNSNYDYLNICFLQGDTIMITNTEKIKLTSTDGGENWYKR